MTQPKSMAALASCRRFVLPSVHRFNSPVSYFVFLIHIFFYVTSSFILYGLLSLVLLYLRKRFLYACENCESRIRSHFVVACSTETTTHTWAIIVAFTYPCLDSGTRQHRTRVISNVCAIKKDHRIMIIINIDDAWNLLCV